MKLYKWLGNSTETDQLAQQGWTVLINDSDAAAVTEQDTPQTDTSKRTKSSTSKAGLKMAHLLYSTIFR